MGQIYGGRLFILSSSDKKVASCIILNKPGLLGGLIIGTNGTNDVTVVVYDNPAAASGVALWPDIIVKGADLYAGGLFPYVIEAITGIYLSISGTGGFATVYYTARND